MKKSFLLVVSVILCLSLLGCGESKTKNDEIIQETTVSTTEVAYEFTNPAVEPCDNVNLMRYTMTLDSFTAKYNEIMNDLGGTEFLNPSRWKKTGDTEKDTKGVEFNYYYYNAANLNFTASVEKESKKIINIGCGTAMSVFISQDASDSDNIVLNKSAIMAAAICGYSADKTELLADIFRTITFEQIDSLWYEGNIFTLSTDEDKENSDNNIMLFRVFPTTNSQRTAWNIKDYKTYKLK